jgi:hypothetical protein
LTEESGWKALGVGIGISEIPLMILLGYAIGRAFGKPEEGIALGTLLGVLLFTTYGFWAYRRTKEMRSGGRTSEPSNEEQSTLQQALRKMKARFQLLSMVRAQRALLLARGKAQEAQALVAQGLQEGSPISTCDSV